MYSTSCAQCNLDRNFLFSGCSRPIGENYIISRTPEINRFYDRGVTWQILVEEDSAS